MSLDKPGQVDALEIAPDGAEVILVVRDSWDWEDLPAHLEALRDKLNLYFAFIAAGGLTEHLPRAAKLPVLIEVVGQYDLPPAAVEFAQSTANFARMQHDIGLRFRLEDDS